MVLSVIVHHQISVIILNQHVVVYYNVDYVRDTKGTNYIRNRILKVAKKLADENVKVRFCC